MQRDYRNELSEHAGCIYLPNGEWWNPERPLLSSWDGDVWSFPREMLLGPMFECGFSAFMHSVNARGDCGVSGDAWANFIMAHLTYLAAGELFDWDTIYIDREAVAPNARVHLDVCLGVDAGRTMDRLKSKMEKPSTRLASEKLLPRLCAYSIAWKVFAARAHRPEFCGRLLP